MKLTEQERRVLLDLVDEEHSRDRRARAAQRTTAEVFDLQTKLYWSIRNKLVSAELEESPPALPPPG